MMDNKPKKETSFNKYINRAIKKWPNVPKCYGWLKLSRRGEWVLKQKKVQHKRTIQFLNENYRTDENGNSYVQNGPQQVFVSLEYSPWIYRFNPHTGFLTHNQLLVDKVFTAICDEHGNFLIETSFGVGLVDDRDLSTLSTFLVESAQEFDVLEHMNNRVKVINMTEQQICNVYAFKREPAPTNANIK